MEAPRPLEVCPAEVDEVHATPSETMVTSTADAPINSSVRAETVRTANDEVQTACEFQVNEVQLVDNAAVTSNFEDEAPVMDNVIPLPATVATIETERAAQPQLTAPIEKQPNRAGSTKWATMLMRVWDWLRTKISAHPVKKRLRVCESVSLGEKRFVAVIQVDGQQFLVGGSSSSISTLAQLEPSRDFASVLQRNRQEDLCQA